MTKTAEEIRAANENHKTRSKAIDAAKKKIREKLMYRVKEWIVKDGATINGVGEVSVTFYSANKQYPPKVTEFYTQQTGKTE